MVDVLVIGGGNAALCAALMAREEAIVTRTAVTRDGRILALGEAGATLLPPPR